MDDRQVIYINFEKENTKALFWQKFIEDGKYFTPREINIFYLLYENKNQIVTNKLMIQKVWGNSGGTVAKDIIKRLRKKLKNTNYQIETYRGLGYKLSIKR